jgi:hypothetical protein
VSRTYGEVWIVMAGLNIWFRQRRDDAVTWSSEGLARWQTQPAKLNFSASSSAKVGTQAARSYDNVTSETFIRPTHTRPSICSFPPPTRYIERYLCTPPTRPNLVSSQPHAIRGSLSTNHPACPKPASKPSSPSPSYVSPPPPPPVPPPPLKPVRHKKRT